MLGTYHLSSKAVRDISTKHYLPLLKDYDVLLTENGLPNGSPPITALYEDPQKRTIKAVIGEELTQKLAAFFQRPQYGDQPFVGSIFEMYFQDATVTYAVEKLEIKNDGGVENMLIEQAERLNKSVSRLETTEPYEAFALASPQETRDYLQAELSFHIKPRAERIAIVNTMVEKGYSDWVVNDIEAQFLDSYRHEGGMLAPENRVVFNWMNIRNRGMVDKIERLFASPSKNRYFITAGAAHLGGPEGILPLLKKKGYAISCPLQ